MRTRVTTVIAAAFLLCAPMVARANLAGYVQNFEGLVQSSPSALSADGWKVFANVFSPDHSTYYYGYGVFPAPNNTGGFCGIDLTSDPGRAAQDMVVYSDYNNSDHGLGNQIEANVFQEQVVGAADIGSTWIFQFDAKLGNLESPTTALAFIKTLDPGAGYATTNFITANMTSIPSTFNTYSIQITITPSMVGQIMQFGFANTASNYKGSGVFYDNIHWTSDPITPASKTSWGKLKSLYR